MKRIPPFISGILFFILVCTVSACQPPAVETAAMEPTDVTEGVKPSSTPAPTRTMEPTQTMPLAIKTPASEQEVELNLEGQTWELIQYRDASDEMKDLISNSRITALFENGRVAGNAGCNQYFGGYELDQDQLSVQNVGSTLMACITPEGIMVQELAFLNRLQESNRFEIDSGHLKISDSTGKLILVFGEEKPVALIETPWMLVSYLKGTDAYVFPLPEAPITAKFMLEGTVSGSAGCNQYRSPFKLNGDQLSILEPASTKKFCPAPPGVMEQESEYLRLLTEVTSFRIDGKILNLLNDGQKVLLTYEITSVEAPEVSIQEIPVTSNQASLSVDSLKNMEYRTGFTSTGSAQLVNGEYREPALTDTTEETIVKIRESVVYGELPDGQLAAAAVLTTTSGGSGVFYELALVIDMNGEPINIGIVFLGDRIEIQSIKFDKGGILVEMIKQGPDDPMCCPKQRVLQRYQMDGSALVLVSSEEVK